MPEQGGHPSTNTEDGMARPDEVRRYWCGNRLLTRDEALHAMRELARVLGIHLVELRSCVDEPMQETKGGHALVWNPCDGPHVGTILDVGHFGELGDTFGGNATRQWEWGPCFTHWGHIEAPPNDDEVLEELRRRFKALTGRAPWER